ncbi:MAG: tRNA uridine-5-carboxymethylaminomethyl(34) synthesis enzyme MnmG [Oscillospiraceae bacterium]|jgi:tRNA uridine 5-carboxymethylaminomethyl modification enzyme|nr:tRNA uridine-5-carboxymethylaminomethyl(34) synthesis enzyme MnmG [Oscillospiraceae bacterium]
MYDVLIIGGGHAGIEAALASARLGCCTALFTIAMDWIGNMPCNPAIGGTSKGHLVREIDALGGEMARAADENAIQCRMLNLGKGAAVHSPRAQIDRRAYAGSMKRRLERQENLDIRQGEIIGLYKNVSRETFCDIGQAHEAGEGGAAKTFWVVQTRTGMQYAAKCVVLATGTFLRGKIHIGEASFAGGPDGMPPAVGLTDALRRLAIPLRRFKTGTPPRVLRGSIDFSKTEEQRGDCEAVPFALEGGAPRQRALCYLTYTTEETKRVILENLHRSPLFGGQIEGVGPRYCPSIEDKVVRFPEKERHPVFLEPCGMETEEFYLQGLSSSLPEDVQLALLRTIPGLEHCHVMRPAYAIEYDCVDPLALRPSLEFKSLPGLFGAGQFNGSSGYEEAAAQGLVAGINAAHKVLGREALVLSRMESYIGTLIDDLVTKGCREPYRMMTSRSECRLLLRHDTADRRLLPVGYRLGLVSEARWTAFEQKQAALAAERMRAETAILQPSEALNALLERCGTSPIQSGARLAELLRRPQMNYAELEAFDGTRPVLPAAWLREIETDLKYEGYIRRQEAQVREMKRLEEQRLPLGLNYAEITALRLEAREKLNAAQPETLGQAARISGVNPADISVLMIWLHKK